LPGAKVFDKFAGIVALAGHLSQRAQVSQIVFNALLQGGDLCSIQHAAQYDSTIALVISHGGFWELKVGLGHGAISPQKCAALLFEIPRGLTRPQAKR
jgi:hypothetical protein